MKRFNTGLSVVVFMILFYGYAGSAAVIHVPGDMPTIQSAIEVAGDEDAVLVAPGTYVENLDFLGKEITVLGLEGASATVIDANQSGTGALFILQETRATLLEGFTLRNGSGFLRKVGDVWEYRGGGVYCGYSSPTVRACIIEENTVLHGGGVYCRNSSPVIEDTIIRNNYAYRHGGGVYCQEAYLQLINCTVVDNYADSQGGGFYYSIGDPSKEMSFDDDLEEPNFRAPDIPNEPGRNIALT